MSCATTPTATQYATITTFTTSTSYSPSVANSEPQVTTVVQESCVASGTISGTSMGCISSAEVTQVDTVGVPNPTLQSGTTQGSGTNLAPIIGGVLGGFLGLIAIVASLWWLCRRRRSWDDIFEKEELADDPWATPIPVRRERDRSNLDLSAEPRPYQYGLVGHVIPPAASGSPPSSPRLSGSTNRMSLAGVHSRHTSSSAIPLLSGMSSRPSTTGSTQTTKSQPTHRTLASDTQLGPRPLTMLSQSSSTAPLIDTRSSQTSATLRTWSPNTDELGALDPLVRTGSPVLIAEQRTLQIANDGPASPIDTIAAGGPSGIASRSRSVIVHTDGGRVREDSLTEPPAYSR
ncbi:hypothetical protein BU15DRAFT_70345 [Melanogaster broomeanus]|nr:hypothetical protein BU15DRAFT_70345 [Melanogaster broomeanus]